MFSKTPKFVKIASQVLAVLVLAFGLPFYFGYGNPLPFLDSAYTTWDNVWLTIFPFVFSGLALGLYWQRLGGYLVVLPVGIGLVFGVLWAQELVYFMLVPLGVGLLMLWSAALHQKIER